MAGEPTPTRPARLTAVMREGERVKPLELFFDLVFVLAVTRCTALMVGDPSWVGVGRGLLVLGLLWWAWTGYAWLTSVVDPEEGAVRIAVFAAMAALLVVTLAVPEAFGDRGLAFAIAYAAVRAAHIALFLLASADAPALRASVRSLALGAAVTGGALIAGSFLGPGAQAAVWALALAVDMAVPYFFGSEGWLLEPGHLSERHGLFVLIALGESIVALGIASDVGLGAAVIVTAVLGIALVSELWWLYFDVVSIVNARRLMRAPAGRERNELARDVYSYLHFALVAGIVLAAFGLHETLEHVDARLRTVPAFGLLGGVAVYLLGHVALRLRGVRSLNRRRLALAVLLLALLPIADRVRSVVLLAIVAALLGALIARETTGYGASRDRLRREFDRGEG
ncbi:MAG TPA: low temperature requirement protein A [Solirubrobacteraceae bacterium]|nr:low temperature requirement protein A [Solirubrobacteraceae bacterium]